MERFIVLSDISENGLKGLQEMQDKGLLKILQDDVVMLAWITCEDMKSLVRNALESYNIEVPQDEFDKLVEETYELWEQYDYGVSYDEVYDVACDVIDRRLREKKFK